jgi:pyruvate carboxylase subunit B
MPGGALTANTQMLRDNGIMDKYAEITANMGEVVKLGGFGTSVTPVSQFYFQQAYNNTLFGPWKKIADGYGKMVLGYFGKTPVEPDPMVVKIAQEQLGLPPTTEKATDIDDRNPKKGIEAARKMLREAKLPETDENIFIAACCEEKGIAFLKGEATIGVRKNEKKDEKAAGKTTKSASGYTVTVNGTTYAVKLEGGTAVVNGKSYDISIEEGIAEALSPKTGGRKEHHYLEAPLPGLVLRLIKKAGDKVAEGEVVLVLESMKMETAINAPVSGVIEEIPVAQGQKIKAGDILAKIAH